MRPFGVVMHSPLLDDDFRLLEAVKDLSVKELIWELSIETLIVAVLPRAAWLDKKGFATYLV
jgi:hypothetical protein